MYCVDIAFLSPSKTASSSCFDGTCLPTSFLVSCTNHCVWVYVTCPVLWIPSPCHVTIFCKSSTYPPTLIVFLEVGALK